MVNPDICWKCGNFLEETRIGNNAYCLSCERILFPPRKGESAKILTFEQRKKKHARNAITNGRATGRLNLVNPCAVCGDLDTESHHEDYDKPLEVVHYCRKHHLEHHGWIKKQPYIYDKNEK